MISLLQHALRTAFIASLIGATGSSVGADVLHYRLVDLGTSEETYSDGRAMNGAGQCVGFSREAEADRAFRTSDIRPIEMQLDDLGSLGGSYAQAYGINSHGQAVGLAATFNDLAYRAFRTGPNQPIRMADSLGLLAGGAANLSLAYDVNDNGEVVGVSDVGGFPGWPAHAFRTAPDNAINPATDDLGTFGGDYSEARAINSLGQVAGFANLAGDASWHAFRTTPHASINPLTDDLGTLGGNSSVARDISEAGIVVGEAQTASGQWQAFRTGSNAAINQATDALGTLGGASSRATGVNSLGDVVGFSDTASGTTHAFVYTDGTGLIDLNDVVQASSSAGWVLVEARQIDDQRRIVGTGAFAGHRRAFVLIPSTPGDIDGDGDVDLADLAVLLSAFGRCSTDPGFNPAADIDGDLCVALADLAILLASFGS